MDFGQDTEVSKSLLGRKQLDHPIGFAVALCAMSAQMSVFGLSNSLSTFSNAIERDAELGHPGPDLVAVAAGVCYGLCPFAGLASGVLSDKFGSRVLVMFAGVCGALAFILASFARSQVEFVLALAPLLAISGGFMVTPSVHAASSYFDKYRTIGLGIAYAGSALGSAIVPHAASLILEHYDHQWRPTFRLMSLFSLLCFVPGFFLVERSVAQAEATSEFTPIGQLLRTKKFMLLFGGAVTFSYGFYAGLYYVVPYARALGKAPYEAYEPISLTSATTLMIVQGIIQLVGNMTWGYFGSRIHPQKLYLAASIALGGGFFLWPWTVNYGQMAAVVGVIGFCFSGILTLYPAISATVFFGPQLGTMLGYCLLGYGIGGGIAEPLSNAIIKAQGGRYEIAMYIMGVLALVSGLLMGVILPPANSRPLSQMPSAALNPDDEQQP